MKLTSIKVKAFTLIEKPLFAEHSKVKGKKFAIKSLPPRRNKSTDSGVSEEEE